MPIKNTKTKLVWCIARFKQRYEYRDDRDKKGSLTYCRLYVSVGKDPESRHFMDQLEELKAKPNWRLLEAGFNELIRRAANDAEEFRGYLLHQRQPADASRIAVWLKTDRASCIKELAALEQIKLIERVPLPEFSGGFPEIPGKTKKKPAKRKRKKKIKRKSKTENRKGTKRKKKKKASAKADVEISQRPKLSTTQKSSTTPKRSKRPNCSTPSETAEGCTAKMAQNPPHSLRELTPEQRFNFIYDSTGREFATAIFLSLGLPYSPDSVKGRQNLGCFKQSWSNALKARLDEIMLVELWDRSVKSAVKIHNLRNRTTRSYWSKGPEAVWRANFNKRLDKCKLRQTG